MRYYSLTISDPETGQSIVPDGNLGFTKAPLNTSSNLQPPTFTSYVNGASDPGALDVEFDFVAYPLGKIQAQSRVKIWGVGLKAIGQASNLSGMNVTIKAGMAPGLPLANPAQAGLVLQGNVFQAYGNWEGVDQTIVLIVNPGTQSSVFAGGVPFFWPAGSALADAVDQTLGTAFPLLKTEIYIDENLTLANDESGYYENLTQFASYLQTITLKLGSQYISSYGGVYIVPTGDTLNVFDGTTAQGPPSITRALAFTDLIGQPTWVSGTEIGFSTVLRSDISVGNQITFPQGIVPPYALTSPAAAVPNVPARSASTFQGTFLVKEVHHFARFREPSGDAWQTAFVAIAPPLKQ